MGCVVGDGAFYFYVQDVVVRPDRQRRGIGRLVGETLVDQVCDAAPIVERSSAQCQHGRSVATTRIHGHTGNVAPVVLREVRETLAHLLDS